MAFLNPESEEVIAVADNARKAIRGLSLLGGLALAGCATAPAIQHPSPQLEQQWLTHQRNLTRLHSWVISGRLGIQVPHDGWHIAFRWEQGDAELYHITLSGPLGQESAELQGTPQGVTLLLSDGHSVSASDPDKLLLHQLGWRLPIKGLYYWVRGLPVPHRQETHGLNAQGRLQWLKQSGWDIAYRGYENISGRAFPTKIFLDSEKVKVRLVIDEWTLS